MDHHHAEKGRQKGNNENKKAERGNNDRPATDGGLEVETDGCRGFSFCLFLHPPLPLHSVPLSPLSPPFSSFLFFVYSLHQDAIIQDISEEELKALTVEEGPRVLSESGDANTHTQTHTLTTEVPYSTGEEVRGGKKVLLQTLPGISAPLLSSVAKNMDISCHKEKRTALDKATRRPGAVSSWVYLYFVNFDIIILLLSASISPATLIMCPNMLKIAAYCGNNEGIVVCSVTTGKSLIKSRVLL